MYIFRPLKFFLLLNYQGERISFNRQLLNHGLTVSRIALLGNGVSAAQRHLSKCLYTVVIGSNDYLLNYFFPQIFPTSKIYTPEQYAAALSQQYSQQLEVGIITNFSFLVHLFIYFRSINITNPSFLSYSLLSFSKKNVIRTDTLATH